MKKTHNPFADADGISRCWVEPSYMPLWIARHEAQLIFHDTVQGVYCMVYSSQKFKACYAAHGSIRKMGVINVLYYDTEYSKEIDIQHILGMLLEDLFNSIMAEKNYYEFTVH